MVVHPFAVPAPVPIYCLYTSPNPSSPLVYSPYTFPDGFGDNKFILFSDDVYINSIDIMQIFTNDIYLNVKRDADFLMEVIVGTLYQGLLENQWTEINNQIIIKL